MMNTRRFFPAAALAICLAPIAAGQDAIAMRIDPSHVVRPISRYLTGACIEDVNHEIYGGLYSQLIFGESFQEPPARPISNFISGMWQLVHRGDAIGTAAWIADRPFVGTHSQRISMTSGSGQFSIENRGLNHQGIGLLAHRSYEGHMWARATGAAKVHVSFTSADGEHEYAGQDLPVSGADWRRYSFTLTPDTTDAAGGFDIALTAPGSVDLGYVFVEPGPWGTFKGLPVRGDVARGLIDEGVTGLRYGGSMVNAAEYRWKKMIGDRDRRPPYHGTWYDQSSNGWGILDFLNFCEAANILPIPAFNIDETPRDMADFIEYVNGPSESGWGAKRAADGHAAPYRLTHIELGNEERVDQSYYKKFEAIARAIWSKDPHMILTVGDFSYHRAIVDPMHFEGADSHITNLSAHKKILNLAGEFDAEVWFDIHVWTDSLVLDGTVNSFPTYIDAIDKLASGAKHQVVIFELNANNHFQRRALANAQVLLRIEQDGRVPFVSSANGLQVDKQNDNGWDQGLLFLNPTQVWLQPPGYALQMFSSNYQPTLIECTIPASSGLAAVATTSDEHRVVVLQALNPSDKPVPATINFSNWGASYASIAVQSLAADLNTANTAQHPNAVHPTTRPSPSDANRHTFPPHSFTVIRWNR